MATIELDIIKQRSDKLPPAEKIELIRYLTASLSPEENAEVLNVLDFGKSKDGHTDESKLA